MKGYLTSAGSALLAMPLLANHSVVCIGARH